MKTHKVKMVHCGGCRQAGHDTVIEMTELQFDDMDCGMCGWLRCPTCNEVILPTYRATILPVVEDRTEHGEDKGWTYAHEYQ